MGAKKAAPAVPGASGGKLVMLPVRGVPIVPLVPPGNIAVVAGDPGGTSGLVAASVPRATIFPAPDGSRAPYAGLTFHVYSQLSGPESAQAQGMVDCLREVNRQSGWRTPFVMENFVLRKFSKSSDLLSPVRILEQVKARREHYLDGDDDSFKACQLFFQQPDKAKYTCTNQRLARWGLWFGRKHEDRHARDALRHLVYFLRRCADDELMRNLAWGTVPTSGARGTGGRTAWEEGVPK